MITELWESADYGVYDCGRLDYDPDRDELALFTNGEDKIALSRDDAQALHNALGKWLNGPVLGQLDASVGGGVAEKSNEYDEYVVVTGGMRTCSFPGCNTFISNYAYKDDDWDGTVHCRVHAPRPNGGSSGTAR